MYVYSATLGFLQLLGAYTLSFPLVMLLKLHSLSLHLMSSMILFSAVVYRHHTLVASVWSQRVHVVKRINKET